MHKTQKRVFTAFCENFMSNHEMYIFHLRVLHPEFVSIAYCLVPLER